MNTTSVPHPLARPTASLRTAVVLALAFCGLKIFLQFALTLWSSHLGYGYFRDEFYFIACGRHLAWGYVDQGPTVALMSRLTEALFGDSLFALRIFPALAGGVAVELTGLLTWQLGGHRAAQTLAMLTLLLCPVYVATAGTLCIPSLEPMFWIAIVMSIVALQNGGSPAWLWPAIGTLSGVGLLTKPSLLFFLAALIAALLCTPQRRLLRSPWFAVACATTLLVVSPFLLWQVHHHWATWEFLRNGQLGHKTIRLGPVAFLLAQLTQLNPLTALLWMAGLVGAFRSPLLAGRRWLGLSYVFFFVLMFALHAKDYYLAPVYPMLFAAGAVTWQAALQRKRPSGVDHAWGFRVLDSLLLFTGVLLLPMAAPVLRPASWVRYTHTLHLAPNEAETEKTSALPQFFADRFGWQELTSTIVDSYRALPRQDQQQVCIFASNYGEAGALDFLGRQAEPSLPPILSGHNNYWLWGLHGCSGDPIIAVVNDTPEELRRKFRSVTLLGSMNHPLAMPFEHKSIYLLKDRRPEAPVDWDKEKFYY